MRHPRRIQRPALAAAAAVLVAALVAIAPSTASAQNQTPAPDAPPPTAPETKPTNFGRLLEDVLPTLDSARKLIDRHDELPRRTLNPFGSTRSSNDAEILQLLDDAIEMLDSSKLSRSRDNIRVLQAQVRQAHYDLADYRRKRLAAPARADQSLVDKANPFLTTREGYDDRIAAAEANIDAWQSDIETEKRAFTAEMQALGLKLDADAVDSMLYSVSGDSFVDMTVVFDNVRHLTEQLQELTDQSGEALDTAKRYYGVYVAMIRLVDRMQDRFVEQIETEHVPRLESFAQQARDNIAEARKLIRKQGGNERILLANIDSNTTTEKVAQLYIEYLREHAALVKGENAEIEKTLATAMNTYKTVKLSSDLAELMKSSRKSFDALMQLKVPYLREFRNDVIRNELQRMTEQLRTGR